MSMHTHIQVHTSTHSTLYIHTYLLQFIDLLRKLLQVFNRHYQAATSRHFLHEHKHCINIDYNKYINNLTSFSSLHSALSCSTNSFCFTLSALRSSKRFFNWSHCPCSCTAKIHNSLKINQQK